MDNSLPENAPAFDPRAFRDALGAFVTGVTIITTVDAHGTHAGLTANSFNSVSLDPPMVLWSLALDSSNLAAFREARYWAVHVLAAGQESLSNRFAASDGNKFDGVPISPGPGGIPLLGDFAARFICRAAFEYEGGDHAIFLGAVEEFKQAGRPPLVYHQGRYGIVAAPSRTNGAASLGLLQSRGLIDVTAGQPRLTEEGQRLADALLDMGFVN